MLLRVVDVPNSLGDWRRKSDGGERNISLQWEAKQDLTSTFENATLPLLSQGCRQHKQWGSDLLYQTRCAVAPRLRNPIIPRIFGCSTLVWVRSPTMGRNEEQEARVNSLVQTVACNRIWQMVCSDSDITWKLVRRLHPWYYLKDRIMVEVSPRLTSATSATKPLVTYRLGEGYLVCDISSSVN